MELVKYTIAQHLVELRFRVIKIFISFVALFGACYYYSDVIVQTMLSPLMDIDSFKMLERKIIYTGLAEAFFSYLKLSCFCAFVLVLPIICWQVYFFLYPGLHLQERFIAALCLFFAPLLFWIGIVFVWYYAMPKAWAFFLSFEKPNHAVPILLEARISEYLSLVSQLMFAFGIAFELPIVICLLGLFDFISSEWLKSKRRLSIVMNFIIAGILTPPDILSQFILAIPLILLYELSIILCILVEKRKKDARYKMDS